jgi:DNA processing protein
VRACEPCLRRGFLLGLLAPRIAALLDSRGRKPAGLLALDDEGLVAAVAGEHRAEADAFLENFELDAAMAGLAERGVQAVCRHASGYPTRLLQLGDPPTVLFTVGQANRVLGRLAREPLVALVGARRASPYGLEMARALGRGLGVAGVPVVSGLALGIDAAAHVGCLAGGGDAVAVVGGGPDVVYPQANRSLYEQIASAGLVMSEMPPGLRPYRWSFPARNRLMAGLCDLTVVVEAAERSGSLITTDFAADLGRVVAAVPGEATSERARGSNRLLRAGAAVVTCVEDVLDELLGAGTDPAEAAAERVEQAAVQEIPDDPAERAVLEAVGAGTGVDGASREAGLEVARARAILSRLEARGLVARDALGSYTRRAG